MPKVGVKDTRKQQLIEATMVSWSSLSFVLAAQQCAGAYMAPGAARVGSPMHSAAVTRVGRVAMDGEADGDFGLGPGQKFGPTSPAHPAEKYAAAPVDATRAAARRARARRSALPPMPPSCPAAATALARNAGAARCPPCVSTAARGLPS